ncbi:hypothetical protein [Thermococcus camini]|uniref:Uncharacterized protein n=1 Tax=Thermococcus camini TaxID=2016373 RepID=A0A7G2D889_9EURY|nr:hypothetical protein [Thermococcus camini]CAD5243202.1 conserved protein of unknown function [Thermococcus camini]
MPAVKNRFVIPAFMFFISLAITFYHTKYLIPQFIITTYIVGFLAVYWKKKLPFEEKTMIVIVVSFPRYFLPEWAVTDNITLALSLGTLWSVSTSWGIHTILPKMLDDNRIQ